MRHFLVEKAGSKIEFDSLARFIFKWFINFLCLYYILSYMVPPYRLHNCYAFMNAMTFAIFHLIASQGTHNFRAFIEIVSVFGWFAKIHPTHTHTSNFNRFKLYKQNYFTVENICIVAFLPLTENQHANTRHIHFMQH